MTTSSQQEADNLLLGWRVALAIKAENESAQENRAKTLRVKRQYATVRARAMQATKQRVNYDRLPLLSLD